MEVINKLVGLMNGTADPLQGGANYNSGNSTAHYCGLKVVKEVILQPAKAGELVIKTRDGAIGNGLLIDMRMPAPTASQPCQPFNKETKR